jgi:hypothetical protein
VSGPIEWVKSWPVFTQPYFLSSPLPPKTVLKTLDQKLRPLSAFRASSSMSSSPKGKVTGRNFRILGSPGYFSSNSGRFEFNGAVESRGAGSQLVGRLGPNVFMPIFMTAWFGFLLFFEIILVSSILIPGSSTPPTPPAIALVPLGMGAFGLIFVLASVSSARSGWKSTESWLADEIKSSKDPGET